ncbi:MAG: hypothetical protein KJ000_36335, partial [Pirellulaceae bacterium]|nr:hypothetical protein [Pirellulaceae bacterium]
ADGTAATGTKLNGGTLRFANTVTGINSEHLTTATSTFAYLESLGAITWTGNMSITGYPLVLQATSGNSLLVSGAVTGGIGSELKTGGAGRIVLSNPANSVGTFSPAANPTEVTGTVTATDQFWNTGASGTLTGTGTVHATSPGELKIYGTLNPGTLTGPGVMSMGNVSLNGTYAVQIDGTTAGVQYDQLDVTGAVKLGGNLNVTLGYTPAVGDSFVLINNDGSDPVTGTFNGLAEGSLLLVGGGVFQITYTGGTGNDVVLTRIAAGVWDGEGADNSWSTPENWQSDTVPSPGAHLIFPAGADRLANVNDLAAGTTFGSILISGSNYSLAGNSIQLAGSLTSQGTNNQLGLDLQLATDVIVANTSGSALTFAGAIDLQGYNLASSGAATFNGSISGAGNLSFSGGQVVLNAANSYSGTTTVNTTTLVVQHDQGLGAADGTAATGTKLNGGTLRFANTVTGINSEHLTTATSTFAYLESLGAITWTGNMSITGYPLVLQATSGNSLLVSGAVTGGIGSELKTGGAGRIVLSNPANSVGTFSPAANPTEVTGTVTATDQFWNTGASGTLTGTGTVHATSPGELKIYGTLNPGTLTGPGILSMGSVSLNGTYAVQIDGTTAGVQYDQLDVTGTVKLGGSLNVTLGYTPAVGDSFILINNDGSDPVTGTFGGLAEGSLLLVGGGVFQITYTGGTGNDVVLTRIAAGVWDGEGADNLWSTAENWQDDIVPSPGAHLIFPNGAGQLVNHNDLAAGTTFGSILISGSNYSLAGNSIQLGGSLTSQGTGNSLATDLQLASDVIVANTSGGVLMFAGDIDLQGYDLTSSGAATFNGSISGAGNLSFSGGQVVLGAA